MTDSPPHIGMMRETPLHASLKRLAARQGGTVETEVDGFVVDVVRDDLLIEIQTSGFSSMKDKLASLLGEGHRVRIVHPIPLDKWIVKLGDDGSEISRRRSPKHGDVTDVFAELVSFPALLLHPALEIEVLSTIEEEYRRHVPGRAWRRKGWVVTDRHLVEVVDSVLIGGAEDVLALVPPGLVEPFTTADLAEALGRPRRLAQQMAYCLREAGLVVAVGKRGNAFEYRVDHSTVGDDSADR